MKKVIAILHNRINSENPDELDVLDQRDLVRETLLKLGYKVTCHESGQDPMETATAISKVNPHLVFNLVESVWDKDELIYVLPAILNSMRIPYTGVPLESLFITTNKTLTKRMLRLAGLLTPDYFSMDRIGDLVQGRSYIVKPIWEEASVGMINEPVFTVDEKKKIMDLSSWCPRHYFIEEYIDGREINVAILDGPNGPEVLSPAEMIFKEYYQDRPKILGYRAKWVTGSEEYQNTDRAFGTLDLEPDLKEKIMQMSLDTWSLFGLKGYARIDFRIDNNGNTYILEVNGNPCISEDSGFVAAVKNAGYDLKTMIRRIVDYAK